MNMQNLQIESAECFGWSQPLENCWWYIVNPAISKGWKAIDVRKAAISLKTNVEHSYTYLATFKFKDLDTDTTYVVFFDNQAKLWNVKIDLSKDAKILPDERKTIFTSDIFKATFKRTNEILKRSLDLYNKIVKPHIENGDLIEVDEIKMEAIESILTNQDIMRNLRLGKYVKK